MRLRKRSLGLSGVRGLSLLEVVLAIAILGVALATIGQLVRLGSRNAASARDLTMAQIYCESKLNEVAAGVAPLDSVSEAPLDELGDWLYSVESAPIDDAGLMEIRVTVTQDPEAAARPVTYTLSRWMIDPAVVEAAEAQAAAIKQQAAAAAAQGNQNAAAGAGTADPAAGGGTGNGASGGGQGTPGGGQGPSGQGGPGGQSSGDVPGAPGGFGAGGDDQSSQGGQGTGGPGRGGRRRGGNRGR